MAYFQEKCAGWSSYKKMGFSSDKFRMTDKARRLEGFPDLPVLEEEEEEEPNFTFDSNSTK